MYSNFSIFKGEKVNMRIDLKQTRRAHGKGIRAFLSLTLVLVLVFGLTGCDALNLGGKQPKAKSVAEAAENSLTALQSGDFKSFSSYLEEGNELLHVFAAMEEESIPEMDKAYQLFCSQQSDMEFTVGEEVENLHGMIYVKVKTRDYGSSIYEAMLDALENQAKEGGDAYTSVGGWMEQGISSAQMGEEQEAKADYAAKNGGYYLQHRGYPDLEFLNVLTGGFYDYADVTMTVCTYEEEGYCLRYDIAAVGDTIISFLKKEGIDESLVDLSLVEQFKLEQEERCDMLPGIYGSVLMEDGMVFTTFGVDFSAANQTDLVNAGIVSGAYDTSFAEYLSLSSTISSFEKDGIACVTTPQYEEE